MAMSGVTCHPDVQDYYKKYKDTGAAHSKRYFDYLVFKIEKGKIVVDQAPEYGSSAKEEAYSDESKLNGVPASFKRMYDYLVEVKARYAVYLFEWKEADRTPTALSLLTYCDDNGPPKEKMLYMTSKPAIKTACKGVNFDIECNDTDDLSYTSLIKEVSRGKAK